MEQNKADNRRYYWLKLKNDFFKRKDIVLIESMPSGKDFVLFYLKLLLESIENNGSLRFNDSLPYNEEMLSTITNTDVKVVRQALDIFSKLNLIDIMDDETIYMNEVDKMLGSSSKNSTERVEKFREKQKLLSERTQNFIEAHINNKRYGGFYYKVLERDGFVCKRCGAETKLMVHHIIPYDANNDDTIRIENLVTLCSSCHTSLHNKSKNKVLGILPEQHILDNVGFDDMMMKRYRNASKQYIEIELEKETELEKDIINQQVVEEKSISPRRARTTFTKPTLDEVRAYCIQRDNGIDPSYWLDYYEARGWMVGKTKMQDWKAAVRTWEKNNPKQQKPKQEQTSIFNDGRRIM